MAVVRKATCVHCGVEDDVFIIVDAGEVVRVYECEYCEGAHCGTCDDRLSDDSTHCSCDRDD